MKPYQHFTLLIGLLLLAFTSKAEGNRVAGMGMSKTDNTYIWYRNGQASAGSPENLFELKHPFEYKTAPGQKYSDIVAIAISGKNNRTYAWYKDGTYSSGTTKNLGKHFTGKSFDLPGDYEPEDIIDIAITTYERVVVWFKDGKACKGSFDKLWDHRAPYSFNTPGDQDSDEILGLAISGSKDQVHAWYKNGQFSIGESANLDKHEDQQLCIPAKVFYNWWGPPGSEITNPVGNVTTYAKMIDPDRVKLSEKKEPTRTNTNYSTRPPGNESPAAAFTFDSDIRIPDLMLAVGHNYMILTDHFRIRFMDKEGNVLPKKSTDGVETSMTAGKFFGDFIRATNADGSTNEININNFLDLGKPCNSPDFPTTDGDGFCIDEFFDLQVMYDPNIRRFIIATNTRNSARGFNPKFKKDGNCMEYQTPSGSYTDYDKDCEVARRIMVVAVSKTEDPRDGFHQYIMTENLYRDRPLLSVANNSVFITHFGLRFQPEPVATVFSLSHMAYGVWNPPCFQIEDSDIGNVEGRICPARHIGNSNGYTVFVGGKLKEDVVIMAYKDPADPWEVPTILQEKVTMDDTRPNSKEATFRNHTLYMIGTNSTEKNSDGMNRVQIQVATTPVSITTDGQTIRAHKKRVLKQQNLSMTAPEDLSNDKWSNHFPAITVNEKQDIMVNYLRYPFATVNPTSVEARYVVWYGNEDAPRDAQLLQEGLVDMETSMSPGTSVHFITAVVDPADDYTFWVIAGYTGSDGRAKTIIGKIRP